MSSPGQDLELTTGNARLQRKRVLMGRVLAAAEDDGGAGDAGLVVRSIRLRVRLELADDGCEIAMTIALGKDVRKEARHGRCPKGGAEILECVPPTVIDAMLLVGCDAAMGEFLARVIAGPGKHQGARALRLQMMHVGHERGADGAPDQYGRLAASDLVDCLPTALR